MAITTSKVTTPIRTPSISASQAATNLSISQQAGSHYNASTGMWSAPSSSSSGSSPLGSQTSALGNYSSGGSSYTPPRGGTSGNAAGLSSPVASAPVKAPVAGTQGNPAGLGLPTGTVAKNMTAASNATSIGPKKPDWMAQMDAIQASGVKSKQAGGQVNLGSEYNIPGGMTKTPVGGAYPTPYTSLMTPNPSGPNYQLQSNGGNVPNYSYNGTQTKTYAPAMTPVPGGTNYNPKFNANVNNKNYSANAIDVLSGSFFGGSSTPSTGSSYTPPAETAPQPPTPKSSMGITNIGQKKAPQDKTVVIQQNTDTAANEAANAKAAVEQATTPDDRAYYQQISDSKEAKYQEALAEQQKYMQMSDDEKATQAQLDAETSQLGTDTYNVGQQPISTGFITGQSKALESASLLRQGKIQKNLARFQQDRQGKLSVAQATAQAARDLANQASTNFENYSSEQRKRRESLSDRSHTEAISAAEKKQTQDNIDRKYQRDVSEFGVTTAQKNREIAIAQQNANSTQTIANNKSTTDVQLKQEINKVLATSNFQNASTQDKKNYILSQGGDPTDFGIN